MHEVDENAASKEYNLLLAKRKIYTRLASQLNEPGRNWKDLVSLINKRSLQPSQKERDIKSVDEDTSQSDWAKGVENNLRTRRLAEINFMRSHDNATYPSLSQAFESIGSVMLHTCYWISVIDNFGIINMCRIGRRPNTWVPADEINTGLGYVVIVLAYMRKIVMEHIHDSQMPLRLRHTLMIKGKQSSIITEGDESIEYPLFIIDGLIVPWFHIPKFNGGLIALLEIFKEVIRLTGLYLIPELAPEPFVIDERGSINGLNIRYNSEECIQLMMNEKLILAQHIPGGVPSAHIVRYQDRSIVTFNDLEKTINVTKIPKGQQLGGECPLCGQPVDLDSMSYEARAYFTMLQQALRRWRDKQHSKKAVPLLPSDTRNLPNPFVATEDDDDEPKIQSQDSVILESIPKHLIVDRYYETFFRERSRLGCGAFGEVYLCEHKLDDLILGSYAIKKIPVGDSIQWLHKVIREVKMRESLNHQNIVSYKHSWLELVKSNAINAPKVPWLFVLMEYCDAGDLEAFINKTSGSKVAFQFDSSDALSDQVIWTLFFDIVSGLQYLHHSGIIHRDLKPSNIMLKLGRETIPEMGDHTTAHALLADFGTAEYVKGSKRSGLGFTGTVEYTAPELLEQDDNGVYSADYDYKSDMWSIGWILYSLAYGSLPFVEGADGPEGVRNALLKFREQIRCQPLSPDALPLHPTYVDFTRPLPMRQVISALLSPDPEKRPSCDFLLDHEFIKEVRSSIDISK